MASIDLSCIPEFRARYPNLQHELAMCDQVSIDSRCVHSKRALFVALAGSKTDGHCYLQEAEKQGALFALVKASTNATNPVHFGNLSRLHLIPVADPLRALQRLARAHREQLTTRVVAITGSYGKTFCKDLLHHLLEKRFRTHSSSESFNSQIGAALSLLEMGTSDELALIECGISQHGEMKKLADMLRPDHAVLTHLGRAHLQTLGSVEAICLEKAQLLQSVVSDRWCLLPSSAMQILANSGYPPPKNWIAWDQTPPACSPLNLSLDPRSKAYRFVAGDRSFVISSSPDLQPLLATVNVAVRAGLLLGLKPEEIAERLRCFRFDPMRLEMWKSSAGYLIINDFYCGDLVSLTKTLQWSRQFARPSSRRIFWFGGLKRDKQSRQNALQRIQNAGFDRVHLSSGVGARARSQQLSLARCELVPGDQLLIRGAQKLSIQEISHSLKAPLPVATLQINLAAVEHNVAEFRRYWPPGTAVMAMVKAMAYGTDSEILAKFLTNCQVQSFGLASVDEAIALRHFGITHTLVALHAAKEQWSMAPEWNIQVCVSSRSEIEGLASCAKKAKKILPLHLHVDTGMCRLGCPLSRAAGLAKLIQNHPQLELEGIMSHFAVADDPSQVAFTDKQVKSFHRLLHQLQTLQVLPRFAHIANSAGALNTLRPCNLVRLGLALYGLHPNAKGESRIELQQALTLKVQIAQIHQIKRGESVSYGRVYTAQRSSEKIAVLPLGYADGLHRAYSGKCSVIIRGRKAPLVGAICMDFAMANVTDIPGCSTGDTALVFGEDEWGNAQNPMELAAELKASPHELISSLGARVQRVFIYEEKPQMV